MLVPGILDIPAWRTVDLSFGFDLLNADNSAFDLTGYTLKMAFAVAKGATPFLTLTSSPAAGIVWTSPNVAIVVQETQWASNAPAAPQQGGILNGVYDLRANRTSDNYSFLLLTGGLILDYGVTPP